MLLYKESLNTDRLTEMKEITSRVHELVSESSVNDGVCIVYSPHTTAGITINENADPDVQKDMLKAINKIIPYSDNYSHMEGNSAAHMKTTMTGLHIMLPVHNGRLVLGTWQGIYFCEYDGPRNRSYYVQILKGIL